MRFTNEKAVLALLLEARVIDEKSPRAQRRKQVQVAMTLLGTRDWTHGDALAAVRDRKPYLASERMRRDAVVIDAAARLHAGRGKTRLTG
jgi:hypothetical protein